MLEAVHVAGDVLMWAITVASLTVVVLTVKGKIKLPEKLPWGWRVAMCVIGVVLIANVLLPDA